MSNSNGSHEAAKLVVAALTDINNTRGSTKEELVEHIKTKYQVPETDFKRYVSSAISKGVAFGAIEKKYGRITLGEVMDRMRQIRRRRKRKGGDGGGAPSKRRRHRKRR